MELHTRINCECGHDFYNTISSADMALSRKIHGVTRCPICNQVNRYSYEFDVTSRFDWIYEYKEEDFKSPYDCSDYYNLYKIHCIRDHFSLNNGNKDEEFYPRYCVCGEEILLHQRRVS